MLIASIVVLFLAPTIFGASFRASEGQSDYELLGEGECRQADGQYPLKYSVSFPELRPHTKGDNADQAQEKCLSLCRKYSWCNAVELVLRDVWPTPECRLTTDRPTFEESYGTDQNYDWAAKKIIDGVTYTTYCGLGRGCRGSAGSNWDGGKLNPRSGYFCFKKKDELPTTTEAPTEYELLGEGECRQADGQYGLNLKINFNDLRPHNEGDNAEQATEKCLELCKQYSWCYAAQVTLRSIWPTPCCYLVTDRPAFEEVYGPREKYSWGKPTVIDDVSYQTYCGGNGCGATDDIATNWNGGKMSPRKEYFCYKKTENDGNAKAIGTKNFTGIRPEYG